MHGFRVLQVLHLSRNQLGSKQMVDQVDLIPEVQELTLDGNKVVEG